MQVLPNEILERIFVHLDIDIIKQLNTKWKKFTERYGKLFKVITIDLLHLDIKYLKKLNPITIKITCSQIYDKMSIPVDDDFSTNYKSAEDNKILKMIKKKLNIIKKYTSLKTIIANFDLIHFKSDKYTINKYPWIGGTCPNSSTNNTLSLYCIKILLTCNVRNFILTLYNQKQKYNWRLAFEYEYWFINNTISAICHKFDKFVYTGSNKTLLLYDKKSSTFIFRSGDFRDFYKLQNSRLQYIPDYIRIRTLKKCNLENVYIYNNNINTRFSLTCTYLYDILNLTYYYFVEEDSVFYILFKNSDKKKFDKKMIIKSDYNLKDELLNTLKKIQPFELIILKNDENFVKTILKYIKIDELY